MPVKRRFDPWISRAKKLQTLLDPCRFADGTGRGRGQREFTSRPLGNHDRLVRIEPAQLLIRPVHKGWNVGIGLVLVLLAVNT